MIKYLARNCPRCGDFFGVVVSEPVRKTNVQPVNGICTSCGYHMHWSVILGHGGTTKPLITYTRILFR